MEQQPIKTGYLSRPQKSGLKKCWVKRWALLYAATETQPPRLETYDSKEAAAKEGTKPSLNLSLSSSFQATPTTQHRSRDFVMDISTDDKDKASTFAVDSKEELDSWLQIFGEVAKGRSGCQEGKRASFVPDLPSFSGEAEEGLQENTFYDGFESMEFSVSIETTAFSDSLNLIGNYILQIDSVKLSLLDERTNNVLYAWPYRYLRRYGRDKTSFSMEAGRKCESGPGLIKFETREGNEIFHNIQNFVNNISGRHMAAPYQPNRSQGSSRDRLPEAAQIKPLVPGKPPGQGKEAAKPPLLSPRPSPPVDPGNQPMKNEQNGRKGRFPKAPKPFKPKSFMEQKPPEAKPEPNPWPESEPDPNSWQEFEPDPLYSEVQEDLNKQAGNFEPEDMYDLPEGKELPLRPTMPNAASCPESSEYDCLDPSFPSANLYDKTIDDPPGEAWRKHGRTEDIIHTDNYIKGIRIVEDEEPSAEPRPAKPVRSKPPKPTPIPKARKPNKPPKNKPQIASKDPVPQDPNDQTYDQVDTSLTNDTNTYDHIIRSRSTAPQKPHLAPNPRKVNVSQMPVHAEDNHEFYDHLQRETNTGGGWMAPKPGPYQPKQRTFDCHETYNSLRPDGLAAGSSGSLSSLGAGMLPEESQYQEAAELIQPSSLDPSIADTDENLYDLVEYTDPK